MDLPQPTSQDAQGTPSGETTLDAKVELPRYDRRRVIADVRELSRVNPWRSTWMIGFNWIVIAAACVGAVWSGQWWAYLLAILVIGTRQHALTVLMHEGSHYLLYRNRVVNDVVCDLFCAFPMAMSTTLFRATHVKHHLYTNTDQDPDFQQWEQDPGWTRWPKQSWGQCVWVVLQSLLGLNVWKGTSLFLRWNPTANMFRPLGPDLPLLTRVLFVTSLSAFYAAIIMSGQLVNALILMLVPTFTVLNLLLRMRATADHVGVANTHELNMTRTIEPGWLDRLLFSAHGVTYHIEHHLFPSVPCSNLKRLHAVLLEDEQYCREAHVTSGFGGMFRELMEQSAS